MYSHKYCCRIIITYGVMDVYSSPNIGLQWYRLMSIYSTLGKKSSSHEDSCDIGKELAKLNGKHEAAIEGINLKLNTLINAGNFGLPGADLAKLKQAVVEGMGEHAEKAGDKCEAPVVCNGESVFFTQDVKDVLASLVQEKARVLQGATSTRLSDTEKDDLVSRIGQKVIDVNAGNAKKIEDTWRITKRNSKDGVSLADIDLEAIVGALSDQIKSTHAATTAALTNALSSISSDGVKLAGIDLEAIVEELTAQIKSTHIATTETLKEALDLLSTSGVNLSDNDKAAIVDALTAQIKSTHTATTAELTQALTTISRDGVNLADIDLETIVKELTAQIWKAQEATAETLTELSENDKAEIVEAITTEIRSNHTATTDALTQGLASISQNGVKLSSDDLDTIGADFRSIEAQIKNLVAALGGGVRLREDERQEVVRQIGRKFTAALVTFKANWNGPVDTDRGRDREALVDAIEARMGAIFFAVVEKVLNDRGSLLTDDDEALIKRAVQAQAGSDSIKEAMQAVLADQDVLLKQKDKDDILAAVKTEMGASKFKGAMEAFARDGGGLLTDRNTAAIAAKVKAEMEQWQDQLEKDNAVMSKIMHEGFDAAAKRDEQRSTNATARREALAKAVVSEMGTVNNPDTEAIKKAIARAVVSEMGTTDNASIDGFREALADAVVAKMGGTSNPGTTDEDKKEIAAAVKAEMGTEKFKEAMETVTVSDEQIERIARAIVDQMRPVSATSDTVAAPQELDDRELYGMTTEQLLEMFTERNDRLRLKETQYVEEAGRYSRHTLGGTIPSYANLQGELVDIFTQRYATGWLGRSTLSINKTYFITHLTRMIQRGIYHPTDIIRMAYTYLHVKEGGQPARTT